MDHIKDSGTEDIVGELVVLISNPWEKKTVYCWYEDKPNKDVKAMLFEPGIIGMYFGIWEHKTNNLTWHQVMINSKIYLFTNDQIKLYESKNIT